MLTWFPQGVSQGFSTSLFIRCSPFVHSDVRKFVRHVVRTSVHPVVHPAGHPVVHPLVQAGQLSYSFREDVFVIHVLVGSLSNEDQWKQRKDTSDHTRHALE